MGKIKDRISKHFNKKKDNLKPYEISENDIKKYLAKSFVVINGKYYDPCIRFLGADKTLKKIEENKKTEEEKDIQNLTNFLYG
jgi:hypothetical protein